MPKADILIVEDDRIVAEDTRITLEKLGFGVSGIVSFGEDALKRVEAEPPDLVLMDIELEGEMDGIEAADQIRSRFNIPVVYVTGYADEDVLERAKVTEPFGYVVKPFEDRELNSVIEIALYKHEMETKLKESEAWLYTTLKSIGDAVITTDTKGIVTFMNPVARSLTGWRLEEAMGRPLADVFNIINEETRKEVENPAARVLREGRVVGLANHTLLITKDGTEIPIDDSGAPIVDEKGDIIGVVLVFRDVGEKRDVEKALRMSDSIVNATSEHMAVLDRNYIYQTVNNAYLKAHKKTRADIVGHSVVDLLGQDVFEKSVKGYLDRCLSGETVEYGLWLDFPGTGHRYMDVAYYPFREKGGRISGVVVCSRDRTQQKRSDEALAESNKRLITVLDGLDVIVYVADMDTHEILFLNEHTQKLFDRDMTGEVCWQVLRGDQSGPCDFCTNKYLMDTGGKPSGVYVWEHYNPLLDKTYQCHDQAIQWIDGRTVRLEIATDVSVRKRAEEALKNAHDELEQSVKERTAELQESNEVLADEIEERMLIEEALSKNEQHLRSLMESAKGFILYRLMVDPKDKYKANVIFVSPSIEDIMGVSPQEDFSEWFMNIHEDDLPSVMTANKKSAETGELFDQLMRIYHPGKGEWRWIRGISNPVFDSDGNPAYYNGLMVDITAEKWAEEKLQETKNTINSILSSATEYAIAATDLQFRIIHYNPAAESIFGYKADEVLGRTVQEMHTRERVLPERFENAIKAVSEYGKYEYEIISRDSSGRKRFIHSVVMPMYGEKGDATGYILFAQDVTKISVLQAQVVRSERLAATGQLAASIAHEINSPLQAITFILNALKTDSGYDKELSDKIDLLKGAFTSIRNTVKNLLDLNRPGKDVKQQTDVNRVIEKTIDLIRILLKKSGVKLNSDLSPRIPGLTASPQELNHVFLNLFNNAIEAVKGRTGRREIYVKTNLRKGHVVIKVTDNGPGIPKEDLEHIFDPFYTRKKKMGLGVGLSVCHDIVKGHEGTIIAENGPEGGAVFTITLPC